MSKDARFNPFLEFFSSQGVKFTNSETSEPLIDEDLTLCTNCYCMTKTYKKDNTCLKCGATKDIADKKVKEENETKD